MSNNYWAEEVASCIHDIIHRKREGVQGREDSLSAYCCFSKDHFIKDEIKDHLEGLLEAFSKRIKNGLRTRNFNRLRVREITLALRAQGLTAVTAGDDTVYNNASSLLPRAIRHSPNNLIKAAAIHCLGACTFFSSAAKNDYLKQMRFFLGIVSSNGQTISAINDIYCITAALREWGLLATKVEDLQIASRHAIPVFMGLLKSSKPSVQVVAGENIALLYEKGCTPGDDSASLLLERVLQSLAMKFGSRIGKNDEKNLQSDFVSILTSEFLTQPGSTLNPEKISRWEKTGGNFTRVKSILPVAEHSPSQRLEEANRWFHTDNRGSDEFRRSVLDIAQTEASKRQPTVQPYVVKENRVVEPMTLLLGDVIANLQSYVLGDPGNQSDYFSNFGDVPRRCCEPADGDPRSYFDRDPSTAENPHQGTAIDRWWKWIRLAALRRILQGGFVEHYYQGNRAVLDNLPIDNLPIMVSEAERYIQREANSANSADLAAVEPPLLGEQSPGGGWVIILQSILHGCND